MVPHLLKAWLLLLILVFSPVFPAVAEAPADAALSCAPHITLELIQHRGQDETREALARILDTDPGCVNLQRDWALLSLRTGRLAEARQHLLAMAEDHPDTPAVLFGLGLNLLYDRSAPDNLAESRAYLERARTMLDGPTGGANEHERAVCDGFCLLALSALKADPDESARLIEESLGRFEAGGSSSGRGLALKQLAGLRQRQGDNAAALEHALEAVAAFEEEDTLGGLALALHLAGNALYRLGKPGPAEQHYHRSLTLAGEQKDDQSRLRNMVALGLLARAGDADVALGWFDRAVPIARRLEIDQMLLYVLTTRGTICGSELNRYRTALDSFGEALEVARQNARWPTAASCLANMGHIRSILGDFDAALLDLQQAAELIETREVSDGPLESFVNREMGYLLWKNGAEEQALARLDRAASLSRVGGDTGGLANALHLQGAILSAAGRHPEALERLDAALEAYDRGRDAYGRACVSYSLGRTAEATGDPDRAAEWYLESARLGESGTYPILAWSGNFRLGRLALDTGDLALARDRLELALETIGEERAHQAEDDFKWSYMEDKHQVFCSYVDVLERLGSAGALEDGAERGFAAAEQAHASALLDLLQGGDVAGDVRPQVSAGGSPAATRLQVSANEVRAMLPKENSRLLEYLLGEDASFLFLLDSAGLAVHRLPPRGEIESLAASYLEQLRTPAAAVKQAPAPELVSAGRSLFSLILEPVEERLAVDSARLVIVADGLLHHLPFEALILPGEGPPRYLIQQHEISYAHSAAVLAELSARQSSEADDDRLDLLAIGDPDFGGREWVETGCAKRGAGRGARLSLSPLPHSGREVRRIAGRLARARVFTGREARKSLLSEKALARARVIHLATHALVDEASARDSAIVFSLAGDAENDGLLCLNEISGLELDTELVVLSACSTGLGRPVRGEGVVGLSRAFISAGSRSVIHTLWPVEDRFTARLMEQLFAGLSSGKSKAAALAEARRTFIQSGAHPHFWAPFVLVGESGSVLQLEPRPGWPWLLQLLLIVLGVLTAVGGIIYMQKRRRL